MLVRRLARVRDVHVFPRAWLLLLFFLLGEVWGAGWTHWQLSHRLPSALDGSSWQLKGLIRSLRATGSGVRVLLDIESSEPLAGMRRVQLNWRDAPSLTPGMRMSVQAKLRAPRSFANGLPFDYEAFLLSEGIDATGYVRGSTVLDDSGDFRRDSILAAATQPLTPDSRSWVAGLVFGQQDAFSTDQWRLAARTGTLHLLVVSGLHVGLIGLMAYWLARFFRSLLALRGHGIRGVQWVSIGIMLLLTGLYVWLAGAGVSLQRAWLMLAVWLGLSSGRWRPDTLTTLCVALLAVLLVNPLIWTRPGFSYSFVAAAALIAAFSGRARSPLSVWLAPQLMVFMAMLPVLLWWGQGAGVSHLLANILAIPFVTLFLLPLTLLVAALPLVELQALLSASGNLFWQGLGHIADAPLPAVVPLSASLLLLWYGLLLLLWFGVPRLLFWLVMSLMLAAAFSARPQAKAEARMLDVGQGQALLFTDSGHALVYDTGPRFSDAFDAGTGIVLPVLRQLGVAQPDLVVVSHSDNDHAGGLAPMLSLLHQQHVATPRILVGQALTDLSLSGISQELCPEQSGEWQPVSEHLSFRVFPIFPDVAVRATDNNASCLVQVLWFGRRFLLTGDIGADAEQWYVRHYGAELMSDVLVMPHHGSRSSGSALFLNAVRPSEVWISSGYHNRFGHPHGEVTGRLDALGIRWLNTATSGALMLTPGEATTRERQQWQPVWRAE
ncbi:DNA internalization-related competence protein ComEC/Rec2 [Thalassolituus sp. LLYu03]|uniref:DNA internalization-related competence protein ComEC/Rec2 n=1 Tax=Thalassolituus sp. LLYu03 TaxID=3421656 RepID=UPI003D27E733